MKQLPIFCIVIAIIVIAACSHKTTPVMSVSKTTYESAVLPLMLVKCSPCHFPSKHGFKTNFENFQNAAKYGTSMVTRIQLNPTDRGYMPFKNAKLSTEEIEVFKKWVSDGLLEK